MSIYIKLEENKMFFRNTKTNNEYTIMAEKHFSNNGLLISNIDIAIEYIKSGIKQIMPKINLIKPKIYLLPMKKTDEITQTEQHAIIEAFYKAGARELVIIKDECDINKKLEANKFGSSKKDEYIMIDYNKTKVIITTIILSIIKSVIIVIILIIILVIIRLIRGG